MISVFLHFFNLSVMAGWMVLAVLVLRLCLKKAPRWITCVLWGLVALRLLVPFTIESPISLIPTAETVVSGDTADTSAPVVNSGVASIDKPLNEWLQTPVVPPAAPTDTDTGENTDASVAPIDPKPEEQMPSGDTLDTGKTVSRMERVLNIAAPVWLVGIGLMLLYELFSVLRVRSRVLDAVLLRDNVWQSDRISSPFIFGLFRPRIYVPYDLEERVLEQVLSHERAHLHRRDHWIKPFAFTLLAVYWYNPLLWLGYVLLCRDIEVACDERVVRGLDEDTRRQYATALLQCGVERRSIAACPLAFGEVSIKQRIKSVLNYRKPLLWVIIASLVVCSVAAVCLLTVPREDPLKVISSQEIEPDFDRTFRGTDTDGSLVSKGFDWLWEHAENPEAKTADIDMWDETNIPLVVSRSKADLDELMVACSDETLQVDMRDWFESEKYDDTYFQDKVMVWLFVPGYDLGTIYDYTVTLEETNKGLRYAVTLQYYSTSMFDPAPSRCEHLLLFETDRNVIENADSLTTRHEKAPIIVPTTEGSWVSHAVGNADLDGDGEEESMHIFHSPQALDDAFMVACKADGTPILRERINHQYYNQCYLVPQDDGSSMLLFVESSGVAKDDCEEFGVLSLKDGERTVMQCRRDGRIYLNHLELGEAISYASSLSDWLENAQLLYECENGSLYYSDELGDTPRYTPLCWMDEYGTGEDETLQDVLENVLAFLAGKETPIGTIDFNEDGQADSLFVLGYTHDSFDQFCLLVRAADDTILTTIPLHTYYNSADKMTELFRVTDSAGKEWLQEVTLFMDGTCYVSDLSMEGAADYRSMTMTEWLKYASETGAKLICYLEGNELFFPEGDKDEDQQSAPKLPEQFADILHNKQTFYSENEKKDVLLSHYLADYDDDIGRYAVVDMDSDAAPELIIEFDSQRFLLVIKKDGDAHYGYLFAFRSMYQINVDGSFLWNSSAFDSGCARLQFKDGQYEQMDLWRVENYGADDAVYRVNGKAVSKEYYDTVTAQEQEEVKWLEWKDAEDFSLYKDVGAAELTQQQARELTTMLVNRQKEIHFITQLDVDKVDMSVTCPFDEHYVLCTDARFTCVQDIRDFVLQGLTQQAAQKWFDNWLDGPYDPPDVVNRYIDYDGKLWVDTYSEGAGWSMTYLTDTTRIIKRTANSVTVEMDTLHFGEEDTWKYTPTLVKTDAGWRLAAADFGAGYEDV